MPLAVDFTLRARSGSGGEGYFRAGNGMTAVARTTVLPEATVVGAFPLIEISISQIRNVRLQSIPAVWSMQIAVTPDKLANGPNRPTATSCAQLVKQT